MGLEEIIRGLEHLSYKKGLVSWTSWRIEESGKTSLQPSSTKEEPINKKEMSFCTVGW